MEKYTIHNIAIRVCDDRHHEQAGRDVLHVVEAVHRSDPATDQVAEDQQVQRRGDRRRRRSPRVSYLDNSLSSMYLLSNRSI